MTKLSIGIVTYDSGRVIGPTLDALFAHWPETLETRLFIVDNESSDDTLAQVAPYRDRLSVVASPKGNMGFGAAHNLLLPMLDSDYHCIMNPDVTLVERATLPTIVAFLEAHPDVGMAVPRILDPAGGVQHLCRRDPTVLDVLIRFLGPERVLPARQRRHMMMDHDYATSFDVPFASGCFLVVRTALLRQLGGFDERIFLYGEDADLTRRLNAVSRTVFVPEASVVHAWQRASYHHPHLFRIHLQSLIYYFRKWGWRWW